MSLKSIASMKKIIVILTVVFLIISCSSTLTLKDYDHIREVVNRNDVKTYKPKYSKKTIPLLKIYPNSLNLAQ